VVEEKKENPMMQIVLDKVTLNIGIGASEDRYENASAILQRLTNHKPTMAKAKARKPEFGIKKDQVIGAYVTLRKKDAEEMLKEAFDAVDNKIKRSAIAGNSINFGVNEYIYFSGIKYDPKIGMLGLNINATFTRKGKRVEERRRKRGKMSNRHKTIKPEELEKYISQKYGVKIIEEEQA